MKPSFLLLGAAALLFFGCGRNKLDIDISGIQTQPLKLLRLDQDLFTLNETNFDFKSKEIKTRYGSYYDYYLITFLNRGGSHDSLYKSSVISFISDKDVKDAQQSVKKIYPDSKLEGISQQANACVKRFAYHFPTRKRPSKLVTCLSGWNYSSGYADSALVIGLDMYLGDTARFYEMLRLPSYLTKKMNEHYILPNLAYGWLLTEFDTTLESTLATHTIYYGKLFYAVNALLPQADDSLIIGYTGKQLKYCTTYEKKLWSYFADNNRLYENNLKNIRELISDGPFTGAISKDCPPRIAMWVGLQIVRSYIKHHEDVTLEQLMKEDAVKVLNASKYRP